MLPRNVMNFIGHKIAVYRPIKKTYHLLSYNDQKHEWESFDGTGAVTSLNRIPNREAVGAKICFKRNSFVDCFTNGEYLIWNKNNITHNMPILKKFGRSRNFPPSYFAHEFTCTVNSNNPPLAEPLWVLRPQQVLQQPQAEQPQPQAVQPRRQPIIITRDPNPHIIPRRIAWIIAEDSSKKDDTCPITLEPISPITAAVTSCYHVFDASAIASWTETNSKCPVCNKDGYSITICYAEE